MKPITNAIRVGRHVIYECCGRSWQSSAILKHRRQVHHRATEEALQDRAEARDTAGLPSEGPITCTTCGAPLFPRHPRCPRCTALLHGQEVAEKQCTFCQQAAQRQIPTYYDQTHSIMASCSAMQIGDARLWTPRSRRR